MFLRKMAGRVVGLTLLFIALGAFFFYRDATTDERSSEEAVSGLGDWNRQTIGVKPLTNQSSTDEAESSDGSYSSPEPSASPPAPSWGPTKTSPRDRQEGRLVLGVQQCAALPFVEWEDSHQGLVRLLSMEDDPSLRRFEQQRTKRVLSGGPRVCNPDQIRYRCCDLFDGAVERQMNETWLNFTSAPMVILNPDTGAMDEFRVSSPSKVVHWANTFFQPAPPITSNITQDTNRTSKEQCLCMVFECETAVDPDLEDDNEKRNFGKRNVLLRYPPLKVVPNAAAVGNSNKRVKPSPLPMDESPEAKRGIEAELREEAGDLTDEEEGDADSATGVPNILFVMVDSVTWPDFKSRFKHTSAFLRNLKRNAEKRDTEPRVAMFENSQGIGSGSITNQPAMFLGKMPKACWDELTDAPFRSRVLDPSLPFATKEATLGSHMLKIAKDAGYALTVGMFGQGNPSLETNCTFVNQEEDMRSSGGADVYQWNYFDEAKYPADSGVNGREGCIGDRPHISYVEQMVEEVFFPPPLKKNRTTNVGVCEPEHPERSAHKHPGPVMAVISEQTLHQASWETGAVSYFDIRIARMLRMMYNRGALEDTVVVFAADHGHNYREISAAESMSLYSSNAHPFLWYVLPPARSSERTIEEKGRRRLGPEQQAMFSNILENSQKGMFVTHFDTHATITELAESGESAQRRKLARDRRRDNGVLHFARSTATNYSELSRGNSTKLMSLLQPSCQDVGVPLQKCQSYRESDANNETRILRQLKAAARKYLIKFRRDNPHCLDWRKMSLQSAEEIKRSGVPAKSAEFREGFEVINITRRDHIDASGKNTGLFFYGWSMAVPVFSSDRVDPEKKRTILYYAETSVESHFHTLIARFARTSPYRPDMEFCGGKVAYHQASQKLPRVHPHFCVCPGLVKMTPQPKPMIGNTSLKP